MSQPSLRRLLCAAALLAGAVARADDDPVTYLRFVEEPTSTCVQRNGVQIQIRSTHATRRIRVWLDRYHMGKGTGDRSRSDLAPGAEPEALGCSRSDYGAQEWRIVRAQFLD